MVSDQNGFLGKIICVQYRKLIVFKGNGHMLRLTIGLGLLLLIVSSPQSEFICPKPGFVVHFDFLSNVHEARDLVRIAAKAGAQVINVVPPMPNYRACFVRYQMWIRRNVQYGARISWRPSTIKLM
jgi:hypothetical protein